MARRIRLSRGGAKKRPFYRIVVTEGSSPRDGRFIERLGHYNPMVPKDHPDRVLLKSERIQHWLSQGATPSDRVAKFLAAADIIEARPIPEQTKKSKPRPKTLERMQARDEAAKAKLEAAAVAEQSAAGAAPAEAAAEEEAPAEAAPADEASEAGESGESEDGGAKTEG